MCKDKTAETVDSTVIKFFEVYDESLVNELDEKNRQLSLLKHKNKLILNKQASEFTECSEFENLLLDAVDVCRNEVIKR